MMPELIERTQSGSETYERYKLPCGTILQKTSTPNPKSVTPSARYKLRGRYATNKTVDQLLAQIEGLPDDPASLDESRHMSAHFVARALMHRAARNPATMRQLSDEANDAWNKARAAGRAADTARAAAAEVAATEAATQKKAVTRSQLEEFVVRYAAVLRTHGFATNYSWREAGPLTLHGLRGESERAVVIVNESGTSYIRNGRPVSGEVFHTWIEQTQGRQPQAPQEELQTTVSLDIPRDDAQPTLEALRALLAAACGEPAPAQALAKAVRVGMGLLQQLEEQLK